MRRPARASVGQVESSRLDANDDERRADQLRVGALRVRGRERVEGEIVRRERLSVRIQEPDAAPPRRRAERRRVEQRPERQRRRQEGRAQCGARRAAREHEQALPRDPVDALGSDLGYASLFELAARRMEDPVGLGLPRLLLAPIRPVAAP